MSRMTKKGLAASLKKLMIKIPLEKITVKDIVTDCGVNRQTFYYHFQDIYDLLGWIYKTEALDAIADYKTYDTWQQGFLKTFQYVERNKSFSINTFHSLGREHLEQFLYSVTFDLLIGVIEELSNGVNISKENKKFIADFYSYAFIGLLLVWLKSGTQEKPENIIEKLSKLIDGDIRRAINKYMQE
ncbi:putative dihydroxyacetone kinase regulator [Clostridium tetanomorphum]|uniref:Dihydroxyacetone kinase transcriptional activator DhaS n=1 Tax=Clostridium tetanomorphum TaxID=1553 RepID=A0A923EEQ4_CLOTT|nr:dihydroxyacetone kinase transcriptional activator DhaS [Clostridium tetanomorphum]KAJ49809.1 transcriptional regulator [Clostridium tetanomorphum DSM 665]MBC2399708.1 dihydroxyacetone kinase transcriptional activator DhaS [Clostridium tetanomorphum]MBP1865110.1 putative dihydroxyacetone kinase regulator [Clostridium tetanomorphum]NRS84751.1 putative dihydroxyacetone kinase regulator [Clostridium tetanomorphum]NRZ97967.1 putative dihydroxyacetone kinase regulator [Clostridium tetanomorphum]